MLLGIWFVRIDLFCIRLLYRDESESCVRLVQTDTWKNRRKRKGPNERASEINAVWMYMCPMYFRMDSSRFVYSVVTRYNSVHKTFLCVLFSFFCSLFVWRRMPTAERKRQIHVSPNNCVQLYVESVVFKRQLPQIALYTHIHFAYFIVSVWP